MMILRMLIAQANRPESVPRLLEKPQSWHKSWFSLSSSEAAPKQLPRRHPGDVLAAPAFLTLANPAGPPGVSGVGRSVPPPALELLWGWRGPRGPSQLLRSTGLGQGLGQSCRLSLVGFMHVGAAVIYGKTSDWKSLRMQQNILLYALDFQCSKI